VLKLLKLENLVCRSTFELVEPES